jgi:hypothetical protein
VFLIFAEHYKVAKNTNMAKMKSEILEKIENDIDLFAIVAKALDLKPASLPSTLKRNGSNLNQYSIVKLVADYLGQNPEDLLEEDTVKESVKEG